VPYAELVKVFDNGAVLTQSECKSARIDEKEFIVKEFVAADDVDAMHLGGDVYFIEVADAAAVDAYSAFAHALVKSGRVAVASWTSRGVDRIVIVRPYRKGLVAQALNFGSLMDAPDYGTYSVDSLADEVEMLSMIMGKKTVAFEPSKYKSEYVANLRQLVCDAPAEVVEIPSFFLKPSLVETLAVMAA
jgi:DNA end-binding protein Ku